jgi:hypothetical protein
MTGGAIAGLPNFIRPAGEASERAAIERQFSPYALLYSDSIGVPLTSGVADWGAAAGPLVYVAIAVYCLLLWRVAQSAPSLFVAYLMAGASPGDLFWDAGFFAIRAIGFAWLLLAVFRPLLMPAWVEGNTAATPDIAVPRRSQVQHAPPRMTVARR